MPYKPDWRDTPYGTVWNDIPSLDAPVSGEITPQISPDVITHQKLEDLHRRVKLLESKSNC